jgi:crossover junction endonuclease MUS81
MSTIKLVLDNRERELIKRLDGKCTVETLDLGDIVYRDENNDIVLVIERKTLNDLKASITDGRSREQKARLLANVSRMRIMYLIEGNLPPGDTIQNMPISTLIGSMINTMLRDGVKVYRTSNIEETSNFLIKMLDKLTSDGNKYFNEEAHGCSAAEYSATLKKKKKANMTPEVWFIAQLSMIPQVTEKVAEEILKVYPTVDSLVKAYSKLTSVVLREKLLADITFPLKTGKTRRIGDKASKRIYQFFYGIEEEDDEEKISEISSINIK